MSDKEEIKPAKLAALPPVIKFLLIANALIFFLTYYFQYVLNFPVFEYFALHSLQSENFRVYQFITHLFLHGNFMHIFLNMFVLWMFGRVLEGVWGTKKMLFYYFFTGIGAAVLHLGVTTYQNQELKQTVNQYAESPSFEEFNRFYKNEDIGEMPSGNQLINSFQATYEKWKEVPQSEAYKERSVELMRRFLHLKINVPTLGASGAVYGILLGFGMLFPNVPIYIYFLFPIKAKYFVIAIGAVELVIGLTGTGGNVANFAHLGGMLFGFILLKLWNSKPVKIEREQGEAD